MSGNRWRTIRWIIGGLAIAGATGLFVFSKHVDLWFDEHMDLWAVIWLPGIPHARHVVTSDEYRWALIIMMFVCAGVCFTWRHQITGMIGGIALFIGGVYFAWRRSVRWTTAGAVALLLLAVAWWLPRWMYTSEPRPCLINASRSAV